MSEMSVEEAVKTVRVILSEGGDRGLNLDHDEILAIRIILDELKALQECSSCKCDHANRGNDK